MKLKNCERTQGNRYAVVREHAQAIRRCAKVSLDLEVGQQKLEMESEYWQGNWDVVTSAINDALKRVEAFDSLYKGLTNY